MVKRYSNAVGVSHLAETFDPVTGKPRGDFVYSRDYDALQAALREALDGWDDSESQHNYPGHDELIRITELRKQFLED